MEAKNDSILSGHESEGVLGRCRVIKPASFLLSIFLFPGREESILFT
jgi:hypothetical protein